MTLLRIDSSARRSSVSRQLTSMFVEVWHARHPGDVVIERDLATTLLPPITDAWSAGYADASRLTPGQRRYLQTSDRLIAEVKTAGVIVIGSPMYNLSISAELKGWIDHIVRLGHTVALENGHPRGLLQGRQAIVVTARGGSYQPGSPRAAVDFQEPYLREILQSLGLAVMFVHAENQASAVAGESRTAAIERLRQVAARIAEEVGPHAPVERS
jgi:FMN-dependent NADH-azoreductase